MAFLQSLGKLLGRGVSNTISGVSNVTHPTDTLQGGFDQGLANLARLLNQPPPRGNGGTNPPVTTSPRGTYTTGIQPDTTPWILPGVPTPTSGSVPYINHGNIPMGLPNGAPLNINSNGWINQSTYDLRALPYQPQNFPQLPYLQRLIGK